MRVVAGVLVVMLVAGGVGATRAYPEKKEERDRRCLARYAYDGTSEVKAPWYRVILDPPALTAAVLFNYDVSSERVGVFEEGENGLCAAMTLDAIEEISHLASEKPTTTRRGYHLFGAPQSSSCKGIRCTPTHGSGIKAQICPSCSESNRADVSCDEPLRLSCETPQYDSNRWCTFAIANYDRIGCLPQYFGVGSAPYSQGRTGDDGILWEQDGRKRVVFQGLWTDPSTGLAYARNRWYDSRTASWLSEDPKGDVDSPNLYAFVGWGPHMRIDPMGEEWPKWLQDFHGLVSSGTSAMAQNIQDEIQPDLDHWERSMSEAAWWADHTVVSFGEASVRSWIWEGWAVTGFVLRPDPVQHGKEVGQELIGWNDYLEGGRDFLQGIEDGDWDRALRGGAQFGLGLSKSALTAVGLYSGGELLHARFSGAGRWSQRPGYIRGTNRRGELTSRATWRRQPIRDAWEEAAPGPTGGRLCPTCGTEVTVPPYSGQARDWHGSHNPSWSNRYFSPDSTRASVRDVYHEGVFLECGPCNLRRGNRDVGFTLNLGETLAKRSFSLSLDALVVGGSTVIEDEDSGV